MARVDVIMPQMGESIAEGTLSRWLKKVGDEIKRDEPIFEISTDKVDAEIPAPTAGVLAEIIVGEGETVPVNEIVARIETDKGATIAPAAEAPAPSAGADAPTRASAGNDGAAASPAAPASAPQPTKSGASDATAGSVEERLRTRSSPLVRKIAAEHGIEIAGLQGSGVAGRVTKRDIMEFIESGAPAPGAGAARPAAGASMHAPGGTPPAGGPNPWAAEPWDGDVVEPMSKMRALISEHMGYSRRTAAHVTSFFEIDLTRVARLRAARRREFEQTTGQKLTYMPFIIKAVVDGLKQYPVMNASVSGSNVIMRRSINIGIAVALDWGLIVPVIRDADDLSVTGLTRALNDLANRARVKKLRPDEVQNGTFTITNPGVFGSLMGTPIINQPQVGIMGVGAIEKRPKVIAGADGEDTIAIRTCAYFSISFDHRVVDGATADGFLAYVKKQLETFPDTAL